MNGKVLSEDRTLKAEKGVSHDVMLRQIQIGDTLRRTSTETLVTAKQFKEVSPGEYLIEVSLKAETLVSMQPIDFEEILELAQVGNSLELNRITYVVSKKSYVESGSGYFPELTIKQS